MKKIIACIGTFFALVALSTQAKNPYLLQTADRSAMEHWVDSVFESLSPQRANCTTVSYYSAQQRYPAKP